MNLYAYVDSDPINWTYFLGQHKGDKWFGFNNKEFHKWFHRCWKESGDKDATKEEIAEAFAEWKSVGSPTGGKCGGSAPPPISTEDVNCETCKKVATVVVVGGTAYIIYRCVRMVPSLLPPFWGTIPVNIITP